MLPGELWEIIAIILGFSARLVCKKWKNAIDEYEMQNLFVPKFDINKVMDYIQFYGNSFKSRDSYNLSYFSKCQNHRDPYVWGTVSYTPVYNLSIHAATEELTMKNIKRYYDGVKLEYSNCDFDAFVPGVNLIKYAIDKNPKTQIYGMDDYGKKCIDKSIVFYKKKLKDMIGDGYNSKEFSPPYVSYDDVSYGIFKI